MVMVARGRNGESRIVTGRREWSRLAPAMVMLESSHIRMHHRMVHALHRDRIRRLGNRWLTVGPGEQD